MNEHALNWSETAVPRYADAAVQSLIERCLAGDEAAYASLYDLYAGIIYRLTFSMLQHKEDAEEVLQDSFEYAFRKLDQYNPHKAAFKTWLYRVAISRCRNKRRRKWLPSISLSQIVNQEINDERTPTPDEMLALSDEQQQVWQALAELTPKLRETAVLRYYEGLTYTEIGDILDIPAKTAESRMRLAHKALRDLLQAESDYDEGR
jgi:RNA polymerase sigma-70 factor (ECF subfamily)